MPLQGKNENEVLYLVARGGEPTAGPGKGANNAVASALCELGRNELLAYGLFE